MHKACANGSVVEVLNLIDQDRALLDVLDNRGYTPLFVAWLYQQADVVSLLTGLPVEMNGYNKLVLQSSWFSEDPNRYSSDQTVECKKRICEGYIGELPEPYHSIARSIADEMGIEQVHFYLSDNNVSVAHDFAFPRVGISLDCLVNAEEGLFSETYKAVNHQAVQFKRHIYHELCHIRGRHTTLHSLAHTDGAELVNPFIALSDELEAELGAMYYLFKIDGVAQFVHYGEDDKHPCRADMWRYVGHLYEELLRNPDCGFSIVIDLREQYFEEKTRQNILLPDISERIKRQLAECSWRQQEIVDQWFIG